MIVPGRLALWIALLTALALLGAAIVPAMVPSAIVVDLVLVAGVLVAGRRLKALPVTVAYEWPLRLQKDVQEKLIYRIENRGTSGVQVRLVQAWPDALDAEEDTLDAFVGPGEVVRLSLDATPNARGFVGSENTVIELRDTMDWARVRSVIKTPTMTVFPSLKSIAGFEELRRHHASARAGIHQMRVSGGGREFDQLRDYVKDDDYRTINWKATARQGRPITSVFRVERSQEIVLCLDCGRMMGNPVGKGTALDRAVDAAIMLTHVANRQGDRVGLMLFRDVVERFVKPSGGMIAVNRIVEQLVDARAQNVFPSFASVVETLSSRQKRRSMIFIFTDLNDPQLCENLSDVLKLISRRHLVIIVSLRDPLLDRSASGPATDTREMFKVLAARELATERATHSRNLVRSGAHVLEADADGLTLELINTYIKLKARQLL